MTIQASHFTPEVMLSAPRRSAGIPNSSGELVLYTVSRTRTLIFPLFMSYVFVKLLSKVSTYSFETHSKTSQIRVLSTRDGSSHLVSEDASAFEPVWLSKDEVIFFKPTDRGCTALVSQNVFEGPQ